MINGLHHVSIKTTLDNKAKVIEFYNKILGFDIYLDFTRGIMFKLNDLIIEVFFNLEDEVNGIISHYALDVTDIESVLEKLEKYGIKPFIKKSITLGANNELKANIAFINGYANEEIELFEVIK